FLQLAAGSDLIDAGTPISYVFNGVTYTLAYNGTAPDLGAFETVAPGPALPGDYNSDNTVDALDYTVWRDAFETSATLPNDETPGTVDAADYDVWKAHFGQSLSGAGAIGAAAIPEPASASLMVAACVAVGIARRRRLF
ncbi:MAG: PEP-CTERM sorting domain-containing protein, partial [Pirellulales bacterium]